MIMSHVYYDTAVPDPPVNELNIMSYEPRRRACKDLYNVPCRSDYIEVLWCLDTQPGMPNLWCLAEVLHVSGAPDQDYMARGVIRYIPSDTYEEQFHFVDFLDRYKLRCSANGDDEEGKHFSDCDNQKNENKCLEWRFSCEQVIHSDTNSDDARWCAGSREDARSKKMRTLNRVRREGQSENQNGVKIKALRNGHASLIVEVEKLKRGLIKVSHHLASLQKTNAQFAKCTGAACVLPRIRQKLALKMQTGLRQPPAAVRKRKHDETKPDFSISYVDGVYPGITRARVECTLQQFESVSRQEKASSFSDSVFFVPEFSYTKLPLQCSLEFRILFKTFAHLCDIIGIVSSSDKKEMARKCGKGPKGELLRLLGTYCYDEEDDRSSANFFPGTNCGDFPPQKLDSSKSDTESNTADTSKADPSFPVLNRKTTEWDRVDGWCRHALRRECVPLLSLTDTCSDMKAFVIVWKRAAELGGELGPKLCVNQERYSGGWRFVCHFFRLKANSVAKNLAVLGMMICGMNCSAETLHISRLSCRKDNKGIIPPHIYNAAKLMKLM